MRDGLFVVTTSRANIGSMVVQHQRRWFCIELMLCYLTVTRGTDGLYFVLDMTGWQTSLAGT